MIDTSNVDPSKLTGENTSAVNSYAAYCGNRLPCGYCRLTNSWCPLSCGVPSYSSVTWGVNTSGSSATNATVKYSNSSEMDH